MVSFNKTVFSSTWAERGAEVSFAVTHGKKAHSKPWAPQKPSFISKDLNQRTYSEVAGVAEVGKKPYFFFLIEKTKVTKKEDGYFPRAALGGLFCVEHWSGYECLLKALKQMDLG